MQDEGDGNSDRKQEAGGRALFSIFRLWICLGFRDYDLELKIPLIMNQSS
jgi:hypothetical protein